MKVMTLQIHYNMNIIKYKVKYLLYLKIFLLRNKKEAAPSDSPFGNYETQPVAFTI